MSELKIRLQSDMKTAMKAGDRQRLGVIRLMLAAVKQREVDERVELGDPEIIGVLDRMIKQRRESVIQFDSASRGDLAEVERSEIEVIQAYLPTPFGDEEIADMIREAMAETGATGVSGMGQVMGVLKVRMQGRADMAQVSVKVKELLGA